MCVFSSWYSRGMSWAAKNVNICLREWVFFQKNSKHAGDGVEGLSPMLWVELWFFDLVHAPVRTKPKPATRCRSLSLSHTLTHPHHTTHCDIAATWLVVTLPWIARRPRYLPVFLNHLLARSLAGSFSRRSFRPLSRSARTFRMVCMRWLSPRRLFDQLRWSEPFAVFFFF